MTMDRITPRPGLLSYVCRSALYLNLTLTQDSQGWTKGHQSSLFLLPTPILNDFSAFHYYFAQAQQDKMHMFSFLCRHQTLIFICVHYEGEYRSWNYKHGITNRTMNREKERKRQQNVRQHESGMQATAERRGPEGKVMRGRDQQRKGLYENATMQLGSGGARL